MRFIPILFSTAMVMALIKKVKTVTRRTRGLEKVNEDPDKVKFIGFQDYPDGTRRAIFQHDDSDEPGSVLCPYGKPGDTLWVREKWKLKGWDFEDSSATIEYADGDVLCLDLPDQKDYEWLIREWDKLVKKGIIKAKDPDNEEGPYEFTDKTHPFSPSIHMKRFACRNYLTVTDIRIERLHDIDERQVKKEGAGKEVRQMRLFGLDQKGRDEVFRGSFRRLWESINGQGSWRQNPWVWVVEFKL